MFFRQRRIRSFHERMTKKCTKNYNARAELLFCSLNLLLSDFPVVPSSGFLKLPNVNQKETNARFINEKAPSFFFNS